MSALKSYDSWLPNMHHANTSYGSGWVHVRRYHPDELLKGSLELLEIPMDSHTVSLHKHSGLDWASWRSHERSPQCSPRFLPELLHPSLNTTWLLHLHILPVATPNTRSALQPSKTFGGFLVWLNRDFLGAWWNFSASHIPHKTCYDYNDNDNVSFLARASRGFAQKERLLVHHSLSIPW